MKVCIAEKPSVAREIADVLGAKTKRDGYFEGNGYAVTYTFGHLCTLKEPNDYKPHWKRWDLNNLPMLPDKFDTKVSGDSGYLLACEINNITIDRSVFLVLRICFVQAHAEIEKIVTRKKCYYINRIQ